jgi:ribonuclease T2
MKPIAIRKHFWVPACAGMTIVSSAFAQAVCRLPSRLDTAFVEAPQIVQSKKVTVDSYLLALSWSPNFCATGRGGRDATFQCQDNHFSWVVHGLWPNSSTARSNDEQPAACATATPISEATYRHYLCLVPGVKLMSHEWGRHGTCAFNSPENYFAKTQALHDALKLPDPQALSAKSSKFTAGELRAAFANANPGLSMHSVSVDVDRKQRLREVRICYDTKFRYAVCDRPGAPDRLAIRVTPVGG